MYYVIARENKFILKILYNIKKCSIKLLFSCKYIAYHTAYIFFFLVFDSNKKYIILYTYTLRFVGQEMAYNFNCWGDENKIISFLNSPCLSSFPLYNFPILYLSPWCCVVLHLYTPQTLNTYRYCINSVLQCTISKKNIRLFSSIFINYVKF